MKKLPFHLHEKWRNIVYDIKEKKGSVKFNQLIDFVRKKAKKAVESVFGKEVMGSFNTNARKAQNPSGQTRTFGKPQEACKNMQLWQIIRRRIKQQILRKIT